MSVVTELAFHPWEVLIPELRRHTLTYCYKSTLLNYSQCSKRSNEEIQEYDTKNPLNVKIKDLRNSNMGVMVKMEYREKLARNYDMDNFINIDVIEALIEIKTERGYVDEAETARNELAAWRAEHGIDAEDYDEMVRIAARLVNVREIAYEQIPIIDPVLGEIEPGIEAVGDRIGQLDEVQQQNNFDIFLQRVNANVLSLLNARGIGYGERAVRRDERIRRENNERRIEISFVAVGPNHHKMILNRPSSGKNCILQGNAVDAAYKYLAKRFEKKKNGRIRKIKLDVKKWPTRFMESKTIKQGVQEWKVAMYHTVYKEFMEHMRLDTNQKEITIASKYGMGNNFRIPTDIFTVFKHYDIVEIRGSCQFADDNILQKSVSSLSVPVDAVTDKAIHAKIRQLIDSTTCIDLVIYPSCLLSRRGELDKTVILGDLPCQPGVAQGVWEYTLRRNDGGIIAVYFSWGHCLTVSMKTNTLHR